MRLNEILSRELPGIDEFIKECVNEGQWLLFKSDSIESAQHAASYYLKAGDHVYALAGDGRVVEELDTLVEDFKIDELYYFSDLPRPQSLSNSLSLKHG